MCLYVRGVDALSHVAWRDFEPPAGAAPGAVAEAAPELFDDALSRYYQVVDERLGHLATRYGSVLVFSDHGVVPSSARVADKIMDWLSFLQSLPPGVAESLSYRPQTTGELKVAGAPEALRTLETALRDYRAPDGAPGFHLSSHGDGEALVAVSSAALRGDELRRGEERVSLHRFLLSPMIAWHSPDGLFIAHGPLFKSGGLVEDANLLDVVPTTLRALDLPVAADADGRVLEGVPANEGPVKRRATYGDGGSGLWRLVRSLF
jgi:hypothetical protein